MCALWHRLDQSHYIYTTQVVPMIYGSGWLKIIFEENQASRQVVLSQQKKRDQFVFWLGRNFSKVYLLKCKSHILSLMVLGMLKSSQFYFLQRLRQESLRFIYSSLFLSCLKKYLHTRQTLSTYVTPTVYIQKLLQI